ncbi:MAG: hypothetical protein JWQ90_1342 [Hydrocarboniphaga sp.]|uniref:hypothetical protein n=1 Tax=Hydrocarboniphaga sp. TaxID=2033016 RepID=UPI002611EA74|nr:hypothetical protein [Hydrocarboniphaga sp.]MDB5968892.1 hypothetical protein [Hydrocarboniphaga sp.]
MRFSRLIVLWLIVSLAVIRVMGVHVHAHTHALGDDRVAVTADVHATFDAGIHGEHHAAGHDVYDSTSVHAADHQEAHLDHGDRDVSGPGEVAKWPKFGWNLALLLVSLALLWRVPPQIVRIVVAPIVRRPQRPAYFIPPAQAPPLPA